MIIQKIDNTKHSGINIKPIPNNTLINLENKKVGLQDVLYHTPIFYKPTLSFKGTNLYFHPINFEESLKQYFVLPAGQKPDEKQIEAAKAVYEGNHAVTVLPTGTGKTLIAEYAIRKNMREGTETCFTFPTKALANEKYKSFVEKFGQENVGLLTGDIKINPKAPIKIMIEEVYANMLFGNKNVLNKVATVIHDEFHTINDSSRGVVYEKAVMFTPAHVQQVFLTGTIGNPKELSNWINNVEAQKNSLQTSILPVKKTVLIEMPSSERYVPLKHFIYHSQSNSFIPLITDKYDIDKLIELYKNNTLTERQKEVLSQLGKLAFKEESPEKGLEFLKKELNKRTKGNLDDLEKVLQKSLGIELPEAERLAAFLYNPQERKFNETQLSKQIFKKNKNTLQNTSLIEKIINRLKVRNMFPAIVFKLSKSGCNNLQQQSMTQNFLNPEEYTNAEAIIKQFKQSHYLGKDFNEQAVLKGFSTHHAGMTPDAKALTEILASRKLAKVTYATGTLDKGINFPTRTVVITQYDKVTGQTKNGDNIHTPLSINDLHQSLGRAGRRGKDSIGYVVHVPDKRFSPFDIYKKVIASADNIESKLRPEYNFVSQIISQKGVKELDNVVDMSFLAINPKQMSQEISKLKSEFKKYADLLFELKIFNKEFNNFNLTPRGSVISNARGIDGILFSKMLFDLPLEALKPSHLAALACYVCEGDYKNETATIKGITRTLNNSSSNLEYKNIIEMDEGITSIIKLVENAKNEIKELENKHKIVRNSTTPNILPMQFIQKWAETSDTKTVLHWTELIKAGISRNLDEGTLFNSINRTADILKQMSENAEVVLSQVNDKTLEQKMKIILENSTQAWKMLKKAPILDTALKLIK
jgi:superfamily II RNA helicase